MKGCGEVKEAKKLGSVLLEGTMSLLVLVLGNPCRSNLALEVKLLSRSKYLRR